MFQFLSFFLYNHCSAQGPHYYSYQQYYFLQDYPTNWAIEGQGLCLFEGNVCSWKNVSAWQRLKYTTIWDSNVVKGHMDNNGIWTRWFPWLGSYYYQNSEPLSWKSHNVIIQFPCRTARSKMSIWLWFPPGKSAVCLRCENLLYYTSRQGGPHSISSYCFLDFTFFLVFIVSLKAR